MASAPTGSTASSAGGEGRGVLGAGVTSGIAFPGPSRTCTPTGIQRWGGSSSGAQR